MKRDPSENVHTDEEGNDDEVALMEAEEKDMEEEEDVDRNIVLLVGLSCVTFISTQSIVSMCGQRAASVVQ